MTQLGRRGLRKIRYPGVALLVGLLLHGFPVALAGAGPNQGASHLAAYEHRLRTPSAIILHHPADAAFARQVADYTEIADRRVAPYLGRSDNTLRLFIHAGPEEMRVGLVESLGYPDVLVKAIQRVGISPRSRDSLHILRRAKGSSASLLLHVITDEHSQGMMELRYGAGLSRDATWLEEGLSDYITFHALQDINPEFERDYLRNQRKTAFKALVTGNAFRLSDIDNQLAWYTNINRGRDAWRNQYALANVAVFHLIEHYGWDMTDEILRRVGAGEAYAPVIESVLERSLQAFEREVRLGLLWEGMTRLYPRQAAALLGGTVVLLGGAGWWWARRRSIGGRQRLPGKQGL